MLGNLTICKPGPGLQLEAQGRQLTQRPGVDRVPEVDPQRGAAGNRGQPDGCPVNRGHDWVENVVADCVVVIIVSIPQPGVGERHG